MKKRYYLLIILFVPLLFYGGGQLYYALTDGFTIGNIERSVEFDAPWQLRTPTNHEADLANRILSQRFKYMDKGCQSYVFVSEDGKYVLKFIKHQRFRTKPWLDALAIIPPLQSYREERIAHKKNKLKNLLIGWQTAFNELPRETGIVCVHLNERSGTPRTIEIIDKMGFSHLIELQNYQYMIQGKADMLEKVLKRLIVENREDEVKLLLDRILAMVETFYMRGFADNDHAILQNTGVIDGYPLPIDVGQFVRDPTATNSQNYKQALFNKTYRLRNWLGERSPHLKEYLESRLKLIIGPEFATLHPHFTV